ncbi:MAG TPA: hypothetical protein VFQ90_14080, partial [Stellaceae bacterium]|nr:hypothetical protein [Stellaceae bacterium]
MTFFANSGLRFPNLAHPTQEAGTRALEGAGEIWHFLSGIENLTGDAPGELQMHKSNAIGSLEKALSIYKSVIENVTPT